MKKKNLAVLLTCHNRKSKTLACLTSLFEATIPSKYAFDVFLTDDGSVDGTTESVKSLFPSVKVLRGDGSLFWAGGMRIAWEAAMRSQSYDVYLLINDDVVLHSDFFLKLLETDAYSVKKMGERGIYSGATVDSSSNQVTYGASCLMNYWFIVRSRKLLPTTQPQKCDITNANVLWVSKEVVDKIGIFDHRFTHGIADYDYSLYATRKQLPVLLAPGISGICEHDHGKNWRSSEYPLKERIKYLKSPKGLAYSEYLYYIRKHFPLFLPYTFIMLWIKTLLPFLWDHFKNSSYADA